MLSGGCPFSFTKEDTKVEGVERISRHPKLWALGLYGLGYAASSVFASEVAFGTFPVIWAMIGGAHIDHRGRETGKLKAEVEEVTSHVPF